MAGSHHIPVGTSPWNVHQVGDCWYIQHEDPGKGRKGRRLIGPVRTRGTNYFEVAAAEAERRNKAEARKKFSLEENMMDKTPTLTESLPDDYSRALTDTLKIIARFKLRARDEPWPSGSALLDELCDEVVELGR